MTYSQQLHDTCIGTDTVIGNPCRCCCDPCLDMECAQHDADHGNCQQPRRYWWYESDDWDWEWWQFVYFGNDEWCNRTIVLRLWKPFVFVRTRRLRTESCGECLFTTLETWKRKWEKK